MGRKRNVLWLWKGVACVAAVIDFIFAPCSMPAEDVPDPPEEELTRLREEAQKISDFRVRHDLNERICALYLAIHRDKAAWLYDSWKTERDPKDKAELEEELVDEAIYSQQPDIVAQVATGGTFAQKEVKAPPESRQVGLTILRRITPPQAPYSTGEPAVVIRRMTRDRFELWTPTHGWLFDQDGALLNEARPPRRDGRGRKWYGAFLRNGSWVTTDLWEMDRTLTFFSRGGHWLREISGKAMVPWPKNDESGWLSPISLIGWCRCDRSGRGFVLSVGSDHGRGWARVGATGDHRLLDDQNDPWRLCYPRDLEPKGFYLQLFIPSDDGKISIDYESASHGSFVGFPMFHWNDNNVRIPEGGTFGFWPRSHDPYIVCGWWEALDPPKEADRERHADQQTWFYNAGGNFVGWISAARIADTSRLDGMLFRDASDRVIELGKDYRVRSVRRFVDSNGATVRPFKIFSDLRLGFFIQGNELLLAKW